MVMANTAQPTGALDVWVLHRLTFTVTHGIFAALHGAQKTTIPSHRAQGQGWASSNT